MVKMLETADIDKTYLVKAKIIANAAPYGDRILMTDDGDIFEPPLHRINSGSLFGIYTEPSLAYDAFKNHLKNKVEKHNISVEDFLDLSKKMGIASSLIEKAKGKHDDKHIQC